MSDNMDSDNREQYLPIPIGSRHAVRNQQKVLRLKPKKEGRGGFWIVLLGVIGAGAGIWFGLYYPSVSADLGSTAYKVGNYSLEARGNGVYQSDAAVVVIKNTSAGVEAGSSTSFNGQPMTGQCKASADGSREQCDFQFEDHSLHATDSKTVFGWHRQYDNGHSVEIRTSGDGPVPVPFPVGS